MKRVHMKKCTLFAGTIATLTVAAFGAWFVYSSDAATLPHAPPVPQVVVSTPLQRQVDSRLGFLGQFSAIEQVELRAQVGGTLTGVYFKDGDIVHKGDLLFSIDARPYEIRLAQAKAQLETATARHHLRSPDRGLFALRDRRGRFWRQRGCMKGQNPFPHSSNCLCIGYRMKIVDTIPSSLKTTRVQPGVQPGVPVCG